MEASDMFVGNYFAAGEPQFLSENYYFNGNQQVDNNNQFAIDDLLLDFPKEDDVMNDAFFHSIAADSSSPVTAVHSCNSSGSGNISSGSFTDAQFSGSELCVPYDDLAELEWLSSFVEESFSSDDMQNLQFIPTSVTTNYKNSPIFNADVSVPGKARSKRSRAAPCDWSSRLLHLSPAKAHPRRRENSAEASGSGRKCLHCASEKTPQWRTGPLGPKTLCNACGVRFKSGRLVPEYRPAASPTFVSAKHSNSHRKVVELRRQKDVREAQQQHQHSHPQQHQHQMINQRTMFGASNGDEYLIHHPQFNHML
ncbi:hypothetical protein DCAR_0518540 [Daucus carota subsp. sativus]|uniref:GATA transcription factor n=1 Tax=Daucus carota subsp. sativus TaxID=79200 RepID=A0A161YIA4_DAUCS|nr:PREDICTED: GATA transcription factor 12-like [Daucus carota subsp. sativus]WOG99192.1 hypothetical protein DCAR_0518540 [Daucus carota subsp. sativus]